MSMKTVRRYLSALMEEGIVEGIGTANSPKRRYRYVGRSSLVARRSHNPEVVGSNPAPATKNFSSSEALFLWAVFFYTRDAVNTSERNMSRLQRPPSKTDAN